MDTVTHAVIGAVTARATKFRHEATANRTLLTVAALAAAFPDIDYLLFWVNPYRFITEWHRGPTHSFILLPVWAAILSTASFFVLKRRIAFSTLFKYCGLGLFTHITADLITVYGEEIFAPFSHRRYALFLTFDMDPWIGLLAILGLVFGLKKRKFAVLGLSAIGTYLVLMFYFQHSALAVLENRTRNSRIAVNKLYALPQPFIPFHWTLIIDRQTYYETSDLSLFGKGTHFLDELLAANSSKMSLSSLSPLDDNRNKTTFLRRNRLLLAHIQNFHNTDQLRWRKISKYGDTQMEISEALKVWKLDSFAEFRKFSLLPILYRIDADAGTKCVWYTDLRYILPLMKPPFRYGMCSRPSSNDWRLYRLRRNTENSRQPIP